MRISNNMCQPTANTRTSFQSRFVPTKALKDAFAYADMHDFNPSNLTQNRRFVNALNAILHDRKQDVITVEEVPAHSILKVNGKQYAKDKEFINWDRSGVGTMNAIIDFAENEKGVKRVDDFDSLNRKEIRAVKGLFERLKELDPQDDRFIARAANLINDMKWGVKWQVSKELKRLKDLIFSNS